MIYKDYVRTKHMQDLTHQINMNSMRGREYKLLQFRASLEAILLHSDSEGELDVGFNELIDRKERE